MILLDTHCLFWLLTGSERLGARARNLIEEHSREGPNALAAITLWESAMLVSKDRVAIEQPLDVWLHQLTSERSFVILPLDADVAAGSASLPDGFHSNPSDRLIVATARHHRLILLTADRLILAYGELGHVRAFDARS